MTIQYRGLPSSAGRKELNSVVFHSATCSGLACSLGLSAGTPVCCPISQVTAHSVPPALSKLNCSVDRFAGVLGGVPEPSTSSSCRPGICF